MIHSEGLIKRKNVNSEDSPTDEASTQSPGNKITKELPRQEPDLTLMEEVFLLALKESTLSFWNASISAGLRGCILVELGFRGRIELEARRPCQRSLLRRKVVVKKPESTGEPLLDEALRQIANTTPPETVDTWISYMNGDTWNPLKLKHQVKSVRTRVAKSLVEKGILTSQMHTYVLFDVTTYPMVNSKVKARLYKKVVSGLLDNWTNDPLRMDERLLSLIVLAHESDVLENAFGQLNIDDYCLATKRLRSLLDMDYLSLSERSKNNNILWAVFASFR